MVIIALSMPAWATVNTPIQTVESHVNRLLAVLGDPALSLPEQLEKKKDAVRAISDSFFDFTVLSRFTLGADWKRLNPDQQKKFVELYRKLLESIYLDRLLQYKDEKVLFKKETALSDNRSEVFTDIVTAAGNIPMNYRMLLRNDTWQVYDVIVENASLAQNYRSQFSDLLTRESPDSFITILQKKIDGLDREQQRKTAG
jgi:phospholipid transport system substrate-binding protein